MAANTTSSFGENFISETTRHTLWNFRIILRFINYLEWDLISSIVWHPAQWLVYSQIMSNNNQVVVQKNVIY